MQVDDAPTGTEPAPNEQEKVVEPIKDAQRVQRGGGQSLATSRAEQSGAERAEGVLIRTRR